MKKLNNFIKLALVLLIVVSFVQVVNSADKLTDLIDSVARQRQELDEKKKELEDLNAELDREVDEEYIIDIARENGYRFPNEIIINNDLPK